MRSLDPDEEKLWARVAATIRPLSRDPLTAPAVTPPAHERRSEARPSARPSPAPIPAPAASAGTLDSTWDRRLRTGTIEPDRVLDLHGLNLDQAWSAIDRGIERAVEAGDRTLLLITGHARRGEPPVQRGRIRAAVHDWLTASRHAPRIAAVRGAHGRHGGGGSLYIILRRNRSKATLS
ncbi:MAG: Smr/MutS family protein [Sphingomicrobium sp.]